VALCAKAGQSVAVIIGKLRADRRSRAARCFPSPILGARAPAIGAKFANECDAALRRLGTKHMKSSISEQANSLLDTDGSRARITLK
jgi:hypothetical protein